MNAKIEPLTLPAGEGEQEQDELADDFVGQLDFDIRETIDRSPLH